MVRVSAGDRETVDTLDYMPACLWLQRGGRAGHNPRWTHVSVASIAGEKMAHRIALTVDLEPDWGIQGTRALREITPRFLRFLEDRGMRATFFVCSDLMDESERLVAAIGERNEIGSHGRSHGLLHRMDGRRALAEMVESRQRLQQTGQPVEGFRAPFFQRTRGHFGRVRRAGYAYDASMGTVMPGPTNGRLGAMPCPHRRGGIYEFPTSAMAGGLLPLSLTWLRLCAPLAALRPARRPGLIYLHLHEFLPPETARDLRPPLRHLLTRNCGEPAWTILDRALDALDAQCTTCSAVLRGLAGR
jgi:peptidoglycan/xylan/chitin deacetylase (PgdA/CDA1 family)